MFLLPDAANLADSYGDRRYMPTGYYRAGSTLSPEDQEKRRRRNRAQRRARRITRQNRK